MAKIKLNQIEGINSIGIRQKRIERSRVALPAQVNSNTLIFEEQCNLSQEEIDYIDVYENGVKFIEGVNCSGISYFAQGGKISVKVLDMVTPIGEDDIFTLYVFSVNPNASFAS